MHYKFLKKIIGALGFKIIDKNLVKNERLLSKYSYLNIKEILNQLFTTDEIKFVIQIGANDGKRFDDLNYFIKSYKPSAIFVEPIKSNFEDLKKNYLKQKDLIFENMAISVNEEIKTLYKVKDSKLYLYDDHVIGITSFNQNHLVKHGINKNHIEEENVETISISSLLKKHNIKKFELLLIDTEGYDANIVIDFLTNSKLRPFIIFEYIHSDPKIFEKTLRLLHDEKYKVFKVGENIFCYLEENQNKLKII